ncbi:MAG: efflux RND transporter periplasmic adaptor subunit [Acidobacteriota bacterium]|nr:efflux RND transporter periplasmic adaptor subunit [Acidobacteriota bacterium]
MNPPFTRKWLWAGMILVLLLVFALIGMSTRQPAARITAVQPSRQNLSASISTNGKVEPIAPFPIRAQFATFVVKVLAVEGQQVKRGQSLLELDAADARTALARAREQLVSAQDDLRAARAGGRADDAARIDSDLRKARDESARLQAEQSALERLLVRQAATQLEVSQNQLALDRARADVMRLQAQRDEFARRATLDVQRQTLLAEQFKSEVAALQEKVRSARVTAPADGTLYSLPVRAGDFVNLGDLLAEMADLHTVRVRAFIDEMELGALEPMQTVLITWDAAPDRSWQGKTEQIPQQVVMRGTRSVGELLCQVANDPPTLLPNINVNVRIHSRERQGALAVPRAAVQFDGARRYVYVVKEAAFTGSRLEKREIRVGVASAADYEVLSGLREEERIALPGEVELKDGMEVRVVRSE